MANRLFQERVLVAVADDRTYERAERLLRSVLDDCSIRRVTRSADARSGDGAFDCVVVADDLPDGRATSVADAFADAPVVILRHPDSDLTVPEAFDAGAADVVTVGETNRFERLGERVASAMTWWRRRAELTERIGEDLKEQAMDEAPVGITIADMSLPDGPLVYVNEAFETTTGYPKSQALGRNCRFLQGPGTEEEPVAELRRAVDSESSATVELLNYRRDGEPFWNRVDIAPLCDPDGRVTHYVGFQTDITARVRAEEAVERERARLQRLVDHIEGLLVETSEVLVRAQARDELERKVCERIAATEQYSCAWIADCDLSPEAVVPDAWAGEMPSSVVGLRIALDDTADPVARTVATRTPQIARDPEGQFHHNVVLPFGGLVAVPLLHRETLYGVLTVYAETVDEHERIVLGALGRAVGAAIDAFESRRTLITDSRLSLRFEVVAPDSPLVSVARRGDCRLDYEGVVARDDGSVVLFVSSPSSDVELDSSDIPGLDHVHRLQRTGGTAVYELLLSPGSLLSQIAEGGARLTDLTVDATRGTVVIDTTVADRTLGRRLLEDVERTSRSVRLLAVGENEDPTDTRRAFAGSVEEKLTDKQRTALQLAHLGGFFEWPHGISGDELADAMDISRSTYHQHLRAAEKKLVSQFYRHHPN
ncbi:PAS domain S-box-containing protein [Halopelagius inordinatus]|uniref:PAS domain S-box-containing protein n=1 Tax=Halopelagius inordinatus TaxID=553467 RepID=A0A1I2LRG4_9EURY|nr:bacterio-opsin activator domain-containing protein [Halopelagius inordinatus]SFF82062.1 PAS domain S-box-containing protein [Halopelagius inordinatus]